MKRAALCCLVTAAFLAACGGVPEIPGASGAATETSPAAASASAAAPSASAVASASAAAASASAAVQPSAAGASPAATTSASAEASASAEPAGDVPLTGTVWQWQRSEGGTPTNVSKPQLYTIEFRDDKTIGVRSDCNSAGGTYLMDGTTFKIFIGPQTLASCPSGSLSDKFLGTLPAVGSYTLDNGTLSLQLETNGSMSFTPAP